MEEFSLDIFVGKLYSDFDRLAENFEGEDNGVADSRRCGAMQYIRHEIEWINQKFGRNYKVPIIPSTKPGVSYDMTSILPNEIHE